jgi:hypothetical protein
LPSFRGIRDTLQFSSEPLFLVRCGGKTSEARSREQKRDHEAQILILLGEFSLQAVEYLEQASKVATDLGFYRMVA